MGAPGAQDILLEQSKFPNRISGLFPSCGHKPRAVDANGEGGEMTGIPGQGKGRAGHSKALRGKWPDEMVAELRRLVVIEGYSSTRAADALRAQGFAGVTRNSVIGICRRRGIPMNKNGDMLSAFRNGGKPRPAAERRKHPHLAKGASLVERRAPPKAMRLETAEGSPDPLQAILGPIPRRISIMELGDGLCHWPLGEVRSRDFCYCGLPTEHGRVYCGGHTARSVRCRAVDQRRAV